MRRKTEDPEACKRAKADATADMEEVYGTLEDETQNQDYVFVCFPATDYDIFYLIRGKTREETEERLAELEEAGKDDGKPLKQYRIPSNLDTIPLGVSERIADKFEGICKFLKRYNLDKGVRHRTTYRVSPVSSVRDRIYKVSPC